MCSLWFETYSLRYELCNVGTRRSQWARLVMGQWNLWRYWINLPFNDNNEGLCGVWRARTRRNCDISSISSAKLNVLTPEIFVRTVWGLFLSVNFMTKATVGSYRFEGISAVTIERATKTLLKFPTIILRETREFGELFVPFYDAFGCLTPERPRRVYRKNGSLDFWLRVIATVSR